MIKLPKKEMLPVHAGGISFYVVPLGKMILNCRGRIGWVAARQFMLFGPQRIRIQAQEIISSEVNMMNVSSKNGAPVPPLVDIRDVQINMALSQEEKIRSFIEQVKDPYRFKVGDVVVNVSYSGGDATLNDRFAEMMSLLV